MDKIDQPEEVGCWKKEKVLGAGGFGYVILWRNKETNETIALKQCRWGHDSMMTPKHRHRWKLEVDMMSRLNHPNVVKAISVPPELDVPATEMPLLAMEYCSSGDLRKLLNKPENCCGLREKHIRLILKDISSAVNYLHSMRIIHRDLKPENIVIQDINGTMVFKLIDLGYAKELDQGSLCTSFVGTLQYLAPELFMSQRYSCTVDYWSLGLVTHEVITGVRPFLPDRSPAEWIPLIKQKSSFQIRAFIDDDKNIVFSQEISPHHHICSILKEDIESWLQIMLEYDPKKRGHCESSSPFDLLIKILEKKVVFVYCVSTFTMLSFPVDETMSFDDFQVLLEIKSGIPVISQELVFPKGTLPAPEKGMSQFLSNSADEEVTVFLFHKSENEMLSLPSSLIPPVLEKIMRNPRTEMKYEEQRSAWAQAVYLSQQEHVQLSRLIQAFRANLIHLLSRTSYSHKSASRMTREMNKISAKSSLLKSSYELDMRNYEKQAAQRDGFTSERMFEGWKSSFENLKMVDLLVQKVGALEELSSSIDSRTVELQRSIYARSKQINPLEDVHSKILEAYNELKRRPKERRQVTHDNTDIVRLLCLCLQLSRTHSQELMSFIRNSIKLKRKIEEIIPQIMNILQEISDWDSQICNWQFRRQQEIWKVIGALVDKIRNAERSFSPLLSSSPHSLLPSRQSSVSSHSIHPWGNASLGFQHIPESNKAFKNASPPVITPPVFRSRPDNSSIVNSFENSDFMPINPTLSSINSVSSYIDKTIEESDKVTKENEELMERFEQLLSSFQSDQDSKKDSETNNL